MKKCTLALMLFAAAFTAQATEKVIPASSAAAPVNMAPTLNSQLQAACVAKIKPTLKGAERIRDIGTSIGKVDQNINFSISANGGKIRIMSCEVQKNGTLKLVAKGEIFK